LNFSPGKKGKSMRYLVIGVAMAFLFAGCQKSANEKASAAKETQSSATTEKSDQASAAGKIEGMAVDAEGKGVEEVDVSLYRIDDGKPLAMVTTETNGKFILEKFRGQGKTQEQ
jgi:hypothetical protein